MIQKEILPSGFISVSGSNCMYFHYIKGALLFLKKFVQWFALVLITFKTYKQSPINRILPERARNVLYEYDIHFGLEAFTLRGHNLEKL